jgi:glutaminyl-tRNA synthetase
MEVVQARIEASLASATVEDRFQFERLGYFSLDPKDSAPGQLVFNRTISLKDNAAKAPGKA